MKLPQIRLRKPPKAKKLSAPYKILSGEVTVKQKKTIRDEEGKETTIVEERKINAKDLIIMTEPVFNDLTDEVIQRRAWDKYAYTTIQKVNELNKPKKVATEK